MRELEPLTEEVLLQRLAAFEDLRKFFFDMWLQNPGLAENVGPRLRALLLPLPPQP